MDVAPLAYFTSLMIMFRLSVEFAQKIFALIPDVTTKPTFDALILGSAASYLRHCSWGRCWRLRHCSWGHCWRRCCGWGRCWRRCCGWGRCRQGNGSLVSNIGAVKKKKYKFNMSIMHITNSQFKLVLKLIMTLCP